MSRHPMLYVAGSPERLDRLPELLRYLVTKGTCDRCGCPVAYHGPTRDTLADKAKRCGRRLVTICDDCGRDVEDAGETVRVPVETMTLVHDIRRTVAERQ